MAGRWPGRRHRNKLENVQHKKSVTDGHGGHVLESQVRGLRDGHRQRACLQREAVRRTLPSRQDAVTMESMYLLSLHKKLAFDCTSVGSENILSRKLHVAKKK